jgi:hypothetical protein
MRKSFQDRAEGVSECSRTRKGGGLGELRAEDKSGVEDKGAVPAHCILFVQHALAPG